MSYVTVKNTESLRSSKSDQDAKTNLPCATTRLDGVTSSENMKQDVGEEMTQKGQDDGDAPEAKEQDETEEEAMNAPTETSSLARRDADIQEVTEEEEQLVGNPSADEEEASAEEGPGSRLVTAFLFVCFFFLQKTGSGVSLCICSNTELQHKESLCKTTFHLQL